MIEQGLTILVGAVSTILVSNVGDYAVAGVNLVDSINNLIIIFFNAMASGATVVVAQRIGARKNKEAGETAAQAIVLVVSMAIIVGTFAFFFAELIRPFCRECIELRDHLYALFRNQLPFLRSVLGLCRCNKSLGRLKNPNGWCLCFEHH